MMRIIVIAVFILGLFGLNFDSQRVFAEVKSGPGKAGVLRLSLAEVQNYAVKHSIATRNAQLDVSAAKKKIRETTATGFPQINARVSYMNNLQLPTTLIPAQFLDPDAEEGTFVGLKFGTQHNATFELSASQLVFSGSYIVALQAAKVYLRLSQELLTKSEIEVKETVTTTYYLILLAEDNKKTLESNLGNVKKTLYETRELHKAGFTEDTDVDQIQLSVTNIENAVKSIDRQIAITYKLLKYQMGLDFQQEISLSQGLDDILKEIDKEKLLTGELDLDGHIDYQMADTQEKSMGMLLKKEKSDYLPTISAFIAYSRMAMRDSFNFFKKNDERWYPSTVIGLNIDIPIFSSGMRAAKVAQASLELKKAENTKKQVIDGLQLGLEEARSAFSNAFEKAESTEKNVALAKKIYDKTLIKYGSGTSSSLELTQTHNQYLTAESNYTTAVVELLNAKTRLDKALNRL